MSRRLSWVIALAIIVTSGAFLGLSSGGSSAEQSPVPVPASAESTRADALRADFPGGDQAPVLLVLTRTDGAALTPADRAAADAARERMLAAADNGPGGPPVQISQDGEAAITVVPLAANLSGFALGDEVTKLRTAATDGLDPQLRAQVTGGPAFGADIADSFSGANVTLLAVTAAVVALLLIITYRSPVLWLVPLLVIAFADRVGGVVGTAVAEGLGMSPDGSTAGITSVLVFGAGTNYALLLISRYREELGSNESHHTALTTAVRRAGPAIIASNATVVLALLTLLLASSPSTRSLGVQAASGLVVAAVFVLLVLPPFLDLFGRKLFWPFIPRTGATALTEGGAWHRVADGVARKPAAVSVVAIGVLGLLCTGLLSMPIGLSQTEQFRVQAESVSGFETLAEHFPSGVTDPTLVIASTDRAAQVQQAITATPGVVSATPAGTSPRGLSQWSVVLAAEPASDEAFDTVDALRSAVHGADPDSLVGGSDAKARDAAGAAGRDRTLVVPAILAVVLLVLFVLLRSALAPVILVAVTVLSALAALGLGGWASVHVFGFPALDNSVPLFALLFLVALGVDYTIFLVTRAREETPEHGTRDGIVRAVSATGAVITSAGIVLAAVFCVLGVLPLIALTQVGIIVGLGILLDTFVVRTVVIPALFTLIGPKIWWPALRAER
ncbi:MAG: MMPL family transporter [Mycobacterium kyogaense]|uniref:MMPL family transporter n=1 Tax=Mycobacterium kyogaense TaxID=2212479 RepID=UPI002FF7129E